MPKLNPAAVAYWLAVDAGVVFAWAAFVLFAVLAFVSVVRLAR